MRNYVIKSITIAFVIIASVISYKMITYGYVFEKDVEQYAIMTTQIKSVFTIADIFMVSAILFSFSRE